MVATGAAPALAVSWQDSRKAHHSAGGGKGLPRDTATVSHFQTRNPHTMRQASAYYTTFQSPFILKTIGLGQVQSAAVYGRSGLLAPEPAQLATADPFDR